MTIDVNCQQIDAFSKDDHCENKWKNQTICLHCVGGLLQHLQNNATGSVKELKSISFQKVKQKAEETNNMLELDATRSANLNNRMNN